MLLETKTLDEDCGKDDLIEDELTTDELIIDEFTLDELIAEELGTDATESGTLDERVSLLASLLATQADKLRLNAMAGNQDIDARNRFIEGS